MTPAAAPRDPSTTAAAGYWEGATAPYVDAAKHMSWRAFCDELHTDLLRRWAPDLAVGRALKTDLFDEAAGTGLETALRTHAGEVHGLDVSTGVVAAARAQHPELAGVVTDVRHLPYRNGSFDLVFSNSTLDHFPGREHISASLRELHRITAPGGAAIITLDNLMNPLIALRTVLPRTLLRRTGLVPYYVGASLTLRGLVREAERAGFRIDDTVTLMHVPRVAAIPWADRHDRRRDLGTTTVSRMLGWERLARWPSRQITAHFVGIRAVHP